MSGRVSPAQLRSRIDQLDALRMARQLTADERAEADALTHRLYMREWRLVEASRHGQRRRMARITAGGAAYGA